jgi:hypothetical protein
VTDTSVDAFQAVQHWAGQVWDATAGVFDAFKVDTGESSDPFPLWRDLTGDQQRQFGMLIGTSGSPLSLIGRVFDAMDVVSP